MPSQSNYWLVFDHERTTAGVHLVDIHLEFLNDRTHQALKAFSPRSEKIFPEIHIESYEEGSRGILPIFSYWRMRKGRPGPFHLPWVESKLSTKTSSIATDLVLCRSQHI